MGQPVEGSVYRLYQGVSRQPDSLRLEGQVDEAINVWMSVVSGGFEPRPGSEMLFTTNHEDATRPFLHTYRRDNDENYLFIVQGGRLRVFNAEGSELYSVKHNYLETSNPMAHIRAVTAGDVTFFVNGKVKTQYADATWPNQGDTATVTCVKGDQEWGKWSLIVTIGSNTYMANTSKKADTSEVMSALASGLNIPTDVARVVRVGSTLVIRNLTDSPMKIVSHDFWGNQALEVVHRETDSTSKLPPVAEHGTMVAIGDNPDTQVWMEFHATYGDEQNRVVSQGIWRESVAPGSRYRIDRSTMPIAVQNTGKDQFVFYSIEWGDRKVGVEGDIYEPAFLGKTITDITFHRDRLVILSGEHIDCSAQGEYFNFFPQRSSEVLDTDPFSRTASSRNVNYLYHAIPFRSQLFVMSDNGQFELRGDPTLTPKTATLELATQYQAESVCAPVVMGSELYFPATVDQNVTTLFEYYFQEASVSHSATNATIQVEDYVPGPAVKMVADSVTNTLFLLTEKEPNVIYVYKTFWDGTDKKQSSWSRWEFDFTVANIAMFLDRLLLVTLDDKKLTAYQIPLSNASPLLEGLPSQYHLDSVVRAVGVEKDLANRRTTATFTNTFKPNTQVYCVLVAGEDSRIMQGTVRADGKTVDVPDAADFEYEVYAGYPFDSSVTLSKLYPKDAEGRAIQHGRTQLKRLSVDYEKSAYFNVVWQYPGRQTKRSPFDSLEKRDLINVGKFPERLDGVHDVKLRGSSDRLRIKIGSTLPYPYKITGIRWRGTYHDKYGG